MSRARATALAIVNWKGVFYERYLLDRHVTALEGANGAGKTTVMIAAYVVLLPDMTRLRFTNLGESGATGGDRGVWGRLGEMGRPSYAALELELGSGGRVIAGIHLERKAEPTVELTPFLVSGLQLEGRLQEILLLSDGDHEQVPQLSELRKNVTRLGGTIEVFQTTREYFAALFDKGVTALRLTTDEDRNKFNEMLRTSMTGGISRALTSELRSFLLKEESGLGDTLARMRNSLDACHRTRTEVRESRRLEHEISGVFEAGAAMFACAFAAAQRRADELAARISEAEQAYEQALQIAEQREAAGQEGRRRQTEIRLLMAVAREAHEKAILKRAKLLRVGELGARLCELERGLATAAELAHAANARYEAAAQDRGARGIDLDRAREAYERAAHGIADMQAGLEELHRRAHAHRNVCQHFEQARRLLEDSTLDQMGVGAALEAAKVRLGELDLARARVDRETQSLAAQRDERQRAMDALAGLVEKVDAAHPHEQARGELARLFDRESLAKRLPELQADEEQAQVLAERQATVRQRAAELGQAMRRAGAEGLQSGWNLGGAATGTDSAASTVEGHLRETEAAARAAEQEARLEETRLASARQTAAAGHERIRALEARALVWGKLRVAVERLEGHLKPPGGSSQTALSIRSRAGLDLARARLREQRDEARAALVRLEQDREDRLRRAGALDESKGEFHTDLLRIRDELDGELLASRFEEIEPSQAAGAQAELGALAEAIVVHDPEEAGRRILGCARELATVWLVRADTPLGLEGNQLAVSEDGQDALVREAYGARVVRLAARPTLGRLARERHAEELRVEAARLDSEVERAREQMRAVEGLSGDADRLLADIAVLEAGDPNQAIHAARTDAEAAARAQAEHDRRRVDALERAASLRRVVDGLRGLLADAFLLAPPDYASRAAELSALRQQACHAQEEVRRTAADRRVLTELLDALRNAPPADSTLEERAQARAELDAERDRLFRASEALQAVAKNLPALAWTDAERALAEQTNVVPALERQLECAREGVAAAQAALSAAEANWDACAREWQRLEAERQAAAAQCERVRAEIAVEGVVDASERAQLAVAKEVEEREAERASLAREELALASEVAIHEERGREAERLAGTAKASLAAVREAAGPAESGWRKLRSMAEQAGVTGAELGDSYTRAAAEATSQDLWPEARSKSDLMLDRLAAVRGGEEAAEPIRQALAEKELPAEQAYLRAWILAREWLSRRLPAQVAEGNQPVLGLLRLRDQLATLEDRLTRQESDLRGASEDVARGIEVQIRRTTAQIRRLNQNLEGVSFGSIAGIRVQARRVERMQQILAALREGAVQELLFQTTLPIEEALDEIFRRYGGGKTGGQRILDYREYIELGVEVKRHVEKDWEGASPTRLSTGEAIGVGAALMMVVLTEWERDATLLRARRPFGSLRFLFLDEANRLSQDNLGVLFDLCRNLDLQLLIAAPEVARAEGNTTYRLVRRVTEDGREEVIVSGRRTLTDAEGGTAASAAAAEQTAAAAEQTAAAAEQTAAAAEQTAAAAEQTAAAAEQTAAAAEQTAAAAEQTAAEQTAAAAEQTAAEQTASAVAEVGAAVTDDAAGPAGAPS